MRARQALLNLEAEKQVMDVYRPILSEDLSLSGDVVEEHRMGQRKDGLAWFWHMGMPNEDQSNEWMDECK